MSETLTANKLWKASGTTLSFKDWIQREKDKGVFIKNDALASVVEDSKKDLGISINEDEYRKAQSQKIFGINKYIVYGSLAIVTIAIIYKLQNKK